MKHKKGKVNEVTHRPLNDLIAVLDTANTLKQSYTWGTDLSGSKQGAGGVGGLLWIYDSSTSARYFASYDGNGNVSGLVKSTDGTVSAQYDYGPFGEVIRQTGAMATNNPFRFSTKFADNETDFLYYGYRYYIPSTGRWLSRDPLGENGFRLIANNKNAREQESRVGQYIFLNNTPTSSVDYLGLCCCRFEVKPGVDAALSDIRNWFSTLQPNDQKRQCNRLMDFLGYINPFGDGGGGVAWDIEPLKTWGTSGQMSSFGGKCYYSGSINYSEWGAVCKLCHDAAEKNEWMTVISGYPYPTVYPMKNDFTLEAAQRLVKDWKSVVYGDTGETAQEAVAFTAYGYNGNLTHGGIPGCQWSGKTYPNSGFQWFWSPLRSR